MLPKVSAALSKFIKPIASSAAQVPINRREQGAQDRRGKKKKENSESQAGADFKRTVPPVVPGEELSNREGTGPGLRRSPVPPKAARPGNSEPGASVSLNFVQILERFRSRNGGLFRFLGLSTYTASSRKGKSGARFKKGIMLDSKIR